MTHEIHKYFDMANEFDVCLLIYVKSFTNYSVTVSFLNCRARHLYEIQYFKIIPKKQANSRSIGSTLGPLLFLIYINNLLSDSTSHSKSFADNIAIITAVTDIAVPTYKM